MIVKLAALGLAAAIGVSAIAWTQFGGVVPNSAAAPGALRNSDAAVAAPPQAPPAAPPVEMLPARLLDCHLGRITNFDPNAARLPTTAELKFEGNHLVRLFLPMIPKRTSEPPRSTQAPEPVDPKTRIVADPDGISRGAIGRPFDRVVDYWPDRVEMTTPVQPDQVNLIVLQKSETQPGQIDMFMTAAKDAVSFDQDHMYSGRCSVQLGDAAIAAAQGR